MCVAAIINKPVSKHHLECMDEDNPHGGGVAWVDRGKLRFKRGLHAADIFAMQEAGVLTFPYLLHFRWATHGDRIPQLTHPFPTGRRAFKGELEGTAREVLIHNGVWNDYDEFFELVDRSVSWKTLKETSDTAVAAYFYAEFPDIGDEIPWAVATARVKNKAIDIRKHGGWSEWEGNEYSNLTWLPWRENPAYSNYNWKKDGKGGWTWGEDEYKAHERAAYGWEVGDWSDYMAARYGTEVAKEALTVTEDDKDLMTKMADADSEAEIARQMREAGIDDMDGFSIKTLEPELEALDGDLVSDDPKTVNDWLSGRAGRQESFKINQETFYKCKMCDIWTKAADGVCGYCKEVLAKGAEKAGAETEKKEGAA
jgi:hypothetical protein